MTETSPKTEPQPSTWFSKIVTGSSLMFAVMALAAGMCFGANGPPDLTKGETEGVDLKLTYNLGPTGLRGWIYARPATALDDIQGRTTAQSRQILVTDVGTNSPASGVINVNDVILGVGGRLFDRDARKSFGRAITEAEKTENQGIMKLTLFRAGKTEQVQIKLRVMGSYSETAPYDCPKSRLILADACKVLEKEDLKSEWSTPISALALLSTGNTNYLPRIRACAHLLASSNLYSHIDGSVSCDTWWWGYRNIFLSEYYLATSDKTVLPAIKAYTVELSRGQGMHGTFGHGGCNRTADGQLHGSVPPYGPVNQCALSACLAIVLGSKCGVSDPEIVPAIGRACNFFSYFVDRGSIPYGDFMEPWPYHENNGKNALAALLFGIEGSRPEAAQFFSKMCTAAYKNREYGHTGQGFSYLWGALGANVGGPAAAAALFKEASWHMDLMRRCDGSFTYDGNRNRTTDNTYYGNKNTYYGLSPVATYVLTYSMPLKNLYITGKVDGKSSWLSKQEITEAIESGRFDEAYTNRSAEQLVTDLKDWSPIVRRWAAIELAKRPEAAKMVPQLISMAVGNDAHLRQSACEVLGYVKDTSALPVLVRLLKHEDLWTRVKAANALKRMGNAAQPFVPEMLQAAIDTAKPMLPIVWSDPVQFTSGQLASSLGGLLRGSLDGIDRKLLYPAIRAFLAAPDSRTRDSLSSTIEHLPLEDVQALAPDILASVLVAAPADTMFSFGIRMGCFNALAKYHFKEGIEAGVVLAKTQGGWKSEKRTAEIMNTLVTYGAAARPVIPQLKELIAQFEEQGKNGQFPGDLNRHRINTVKEAIKAIEAATTQPELRSITMVMPKGISEK